MRVLTLPASESAYISEYYPDQNYSGENVLYISRFEQPGDSYRSLLRFDLSKMNNTYPQGVKIRSAYLQLYIDRNEIKSSHIKVGIYRILATWDKNLVSWYNQAPAHTQAEQTFIIPYEWKGLILADLTSTIQGWFEGSITNHGIIIWGDEENNCLIGMRSTNYPDLNAHPRLKILIEDEK